MAKGRPDWSPTAVDVVLRPEWAAKEGTDKTFIASSTNVARGGPLIPQISYVVPVGLALYIRGFSFFSYATEAADGDSNQISDCDVRNATAVATFGLLGGNGGGGMILDKPGVITGPSRFTAKVTNRANHNCNLGVIAWGYEI